MVKVAIYARVSTTDKEQKPENQLLILREFCKHRGWQIHKEYVDEASAANLRGRTAWRELLVAASKKSFDIILILRLDRAFRSVIETHRTLADFDRWGVGFVSSTQPIDTTAPEGRLMLTILAAFAEFERDIIQKRIAEGLDRAKAQGHKLGRKPGSKDDKPRKKSGYLHRWQVRRK